MFDSKKNHQSDGLHVVASRRIKNLLSPNIVPNKSTNVHHLSWITGCSVQFVTFVLYGHTVLDKMESHNLVCLYISNRNTPQREVNVFDMNNTNRTAFQTKYIPR